MKIAFRQVPFSEAQMQTLREIAAAGGYETLWFREDDLPNPEDMKDCEVLMGYFPSEMIVAMPALKWVQTPSAGVERMCRDIYRNPDTILTNSSGAFGVAIAEYMIGGLLMVMRNMPAYQRNQQEHLWRYAGPCRSIFGSRITVVGMGDIGTKFAARAKAMGAYIRGVRRSRCDVPENFDEVFTSDCLADAVRDVDAVVMCLPGTKETAQILSKEIIEAMGPQTIVVNCGRGTTVDQDALMEALRKKRIAGAVLDVFAEEPLAKDSPLWDLENVVITPHVSGRDVDPMNIGPMFEIFAENLRRWVEKKPLLHVVDRARGY